jgi:hypothetical protein
VTGMAPGTPRASTRAWATSGRAAERRPSDRSRAAPTSVRTRSGRAAATGCDRRTVLGTDHGPARR